jgi:diadenosine tetraphosphate (Ap4A) HIT family hydrolase
MYDENNIFAKILRQEIPCNKIYEDEYVLAFDDIAPKAPVHILIIPKNSYKDFAHFSTHATQQELVNYFRVIPEIAAIAKVNDSGYRLITNNGKDANQLVYHFHMHMLGGKFLHSDL